jgi:hypothetical protein
LVTSLQIAWGCLRSEIYLQILTIFRRERISAVIYSKCIGLRSLDRIKFIRLSHQYPKYFHFSLKGQLKRWKIDISWDLPILNTIKNQDQNIYSYSDVRINYVFELQDYAWYYFFKVNSILRNNCWRISSSFTSSSQMALRSNADPHLLNILPLISSVFYLSIPILIFL